MYQKIRFVTSFVPIVPFIKSDAIKFLCGIPSGLILSRNLVVSTIVVDVLKKLVL